MTKKQCLCLECARRGLAVLAIAVALVATSGLVRSMKAQQPVERASLVNGVPDPAAAGRIKSVAADGDSQYRIGPGDELTIQVFNKAQLSRDERVDVRGMIRMPLIDDDIRAACRTESELAEEIARMYRERQLLKSPSVFVSVKDFQSQPVAVMGSVNAPGRFMLRRRIRLLELLVFQAGGPAATAGRKIQILSTVPLANCEVSATEPAGSETRSEGNFATYDLRDLLDGKELANPYVHQGDIINIPAADQAFIVGNVRNPSAIPIVGPVTLSHALAVVGGTLANSQKDKIRVTRGTSTIGVTREILVDLNSTDRSMGRDFLLQGGDTVEVGTKGGFQNVLKQIILPNVIGMPIRVIP